MVGTWGPPHIDTTKGENTDGDQLDNYSEYIAGLNPNVADFFELSIVGVVENDRLNWQEIENRYYDLYWTTDLTTTSWTLIEEDIQGGQAVVTRLPEHPKGFYRVKVRLK